MDLLTANAVKKKQEVILQYLKKITKKPLTADEEQKEQLRQFQQQVDQKYRRSRHNHIYKFPFELSSYSNDSSLDELREITVYDLKNQNIMKSPTNRLSQKSRDYTNKSKQLLKIMSESSVPKSSIRYKTDYDENRSQDLSKLINKSTHLNINKSLLNASQDKKRTSLNKSTATRQDFKHQTSRINKWQVLQLLKHNDSSMHSKRTFNNSIQNKTINDVISASFNTSTHKGNISNYYLSKFTQQKMEMLKLQQNSQLVKQHSPDNEPKMNSLDVKKYKKIKSLKQFFSQKSPQTQKSNKCDQSSTINLKNKLAEMCKRQPLKLIK